jgi:hypothetical protein
MMPPETIVRLHVEAGLRKITTSNNLSSAVRIPAVANRNDLDTNSVVVYVINDAKLTPSGRIAASQFVAEGLADTARILRQRSVDELEAGRSDRLRKFF